MHMELTVKNHHRAMYDARPGPGEELQLGQGERNERDGSRDITCTYSYAARPDQDVRSPHHIDYRGDMPPILYSRNRSGCKGLPMHMSRDDE